MSQAADALAPIRRTPLYEQVASRLRSLIAGERLSPGDRLPPERELAGRLGVSRSSVRQGLTILRVMGLVEIRHGAGVYLLRAPEDVVPPIALASLGEDTSLLALGEVREVLEGHAARLAARNRSAAHLAEAAHAIAYMDREVELGEPGLEGDRRFHRAVVTAAGNSVLTELLHHLDAKIRVISRASLTRPGQPPRSLVTHRLILEAITRQDEDEAARLMHDHLAVTGALAFDW